MNISTVRLCATSSPVRSGSWTPRRIPQGPLSETVEKHAFPARPPKGRMLLIHQNVINSPKPFKNIVEMNISTVRLGASPSPVPSGSWTPRRIPQGTPSKTVENMRFWGGAIGIPVEVTVLKMPTLLIRPKPYWFTENI